MHLWYNKCEKKGKNKHMETAITQFGIIGAGQLGGAIGGALTKAREQVIFYDKQADRSTTASIVDVVHACPVILLCIPSWEVKNALKPIAKAVKPGEERLVITLAKGVDKGFVTMDKLLAQILPDYIDRGVLYGPMIAEEIMRGRHGAGVLAVTNTKWFSPLRETFAEAGITLQASGDMHGITLCAVLKNIYAIAFGLSEGMHLGLNSKGTLAVMVLAETKQFLTDAKTDPRTAEGIAGLGDMLATGFSEDSFNYRVGKSLAEGIADEHIRSEGLVALDELSRAVDLKKYPVAHTVQQIVFNYGAPALLGELIHKT